MSCQLSAFAFGNLFSLILESEMTTGYEKLRTQRFFQLNSTTSVCPTFARIKDFQIVHNFFFKVANKLGLGRLSYHFSSGFRIPADFKSFVVSFFFDSEV